MKNYFSIWFIIFMKGEKRIMKGIFLGNTQRGTFDSVYKKQFVYRISETISIPNLVIDKTNIEENINLAREAEFAFSTWGMPVFTEEEIQYYFPKLKAVFYAAGSVQSFARPFLNKGIKVFSAWAANAVPVAEYAVSQIILANKGFYQSCIKMSKGNVSGARQYSDSFPGTYGCKVGIIGAGMIGSIVIEMLRAYHCEIMVFDPFLSEERAASLGVKKYSLEDIFKNCITVSNHLANNENTVGMLNYDLFKLMKDNATFINTGRGAQVAEEDLVRILHEKPNATAVLDVTYPEPPAADHPFYYLHNVFLTPHIAGSKGEEVMRMADYMYEEFLKLINGKPTKYEVTIKMLETMA
jgi:phosphoglycerate dehydrogenase-like enzyme